MARSFEASGCQFLDEKIEVTKTMVAGFLEANRGYGGGRSALSEMFSVVLHVRATPAGPLLDPP